MTVRGRSSLGRGAGPRQAASRARASSPRSGRRSAATGGRHAQGTGARRDCQGVRRHRRERPRAAKTANDDRRCSDGRPATAHDEAREWLRRRGQAGLGRVERRSVPVHGSDRPEQLARREIEGRPPTSAERRTSPLRRRQVARSQERAELLADVAEKKQQALEAGGLYVLATERHESRRIDNQLRGRSGRQGDPGRSKFYLALDDDLMRIFGSNRMDSVLKTLGLQDGEAITHPWMNKSLEMAQKKVEARNFDIRKQILKYDDVMNDQRKVIFEQRLDIMGEDEVSETVKDLRHQLVHELVRTHIPAERLRRAVEHARRSTSEINGVFDLDAADRGVGLRGRYRRPGDHRAPPERGRRQGGAQGGRTRRRELPPDREDGAAADARPSVARASRHAGAPAPGDRLPRLRPARSAQRVQERGFRAVRGHARQPARGRHRPAHARRGACPRSEERMQPVELPEMQATTSIRSPGWTSWRWPMPRSPPRRAPVAAADRRPPLQTRKSTTAVESDRPGDLGQRRPQRPVPLRLGQEVQALPRQERLTGRQFARR